jgi:hypothetical protein
VDPSSTPPNHEAVEDQATMQQPPPPAREGAVAANNQRRFARHSVYLDALVTIPGCATNLCKIRDYCQAGMFISWDRNKAQTAAFSPRTGETLIIDFGVELPEGKERFEVEATVARILLTGIGVSLAQDYPEALAALAHLTASEVAAEGAASRQAPSTDRASAVLALCREASRRHFVAMARGFFSCANRHLPDMAMEATTPIDKGRPSSQGPLLELLQILSQQRASIEAQMVEGLEGLWGGSGLEPPDAAKGRSLVAKERGQFADLLVVANLIARAEHRSNHVIAELNLLLATVLGRPIHKANNPIGAAALVRVFTDLVNDLQISPLQRKAFFEVVERGVIPLVAGLYEETLQLLKDQGVRPAPPAQPRVFTTD